MPNDSAADFDRLANHMLDFAKRAIREDGFLIPIGATISLDGDVLPLKAIQPPDGKVDASQVVAEILTVFGRLAQAKEVRAVAWCVDMRVMRPGTNVKTDALVLFQESSDGTARAIVTPYSGTAGSGIAFGEQHVQPTQPRIFVS